MASSPSYPSTLFASPAAANDDSPAEAPSHPLLGLWNRTLFLEGLLEYPEFFDQPPQVGPNGTMTDLEHQFRTSFGLEVRAMAKAGVIGEAGDLEEDLPLVDTSESAERGWIARVCTAAELQRQAFFEPGHPTRRRGAVVALPPSFSSSWSSAVPAVASSSSSSAAVVPPSSSVSSSTPQAQAPARRPRLAVGPPQGYAHFSYHHKQDLDKRREAEVRRRDEEAANPLRRESYDWDPLVSGLGRDARLPWVAPPPLLDHERDEGVYRHFELCIDRARKKVVFNEYHHSIDGNNKFRRGHNISDSPNWVTWLFEDHDNEVRRLNAVKAAKAAAARPAGPSSQRRRRLHKPRKLVSEIFQAWIDRIEDPPLPDKDHTHLQWQGLESWGLLFAMWLAQAGWTRSVTLRLASGVFGVACRLREHRSVLLQYDGKAHFTDGDFVERTRWSDFLMQAYLGFVMNYVHLDRWPPATRTPFPPPMPPPVVAGGAAGATDTDEGSGDGVVVQNDENAPPPALPDPVFRLDYSTRDPEPVANFW